MKELMDMFDELFTGKKTAHEFAGDFPELLHLNYRMLREENTEITDYIEEVFPELCEEIVMWEPEEVYKAFIEKVRVEYEKIQVMLAEAK